jgi:hypothetical protein
MGISPINSHNWENILKSKELSRSYNDGTAELLRNILSGPRPCPCDYENQAGEKLSLSVSGKKLVTQPEILVITQRFQDDMNLSPEQCPGQ